MDWSHKIVAIDLSEFRQFTLTFNTSISFIYFGSKAKMLLEHQKRSNFRGYHIPRQFILQRFFAYVVPIDCPFKERFNEIIHWTRNAGLFEKWIQDSYNEFVERKYFLKNRGDAEEEADIERFSVPIFIVYGWIGGVILLVIEIAWKNRKKIPWRKALE